MRIRSVDSESLTPVFCALGDWKASGFDRGPFSISSPIAFASRASAFLLHSPSERLFTMSQNTTATQPRTVQTADRGKLDIRALVLLAILLAAGFILNFTVGKAISGISGGMISPEFIISAFCLTILVVRPNIGQALVIGLISAAVIQITTTSPFVDFAAEGIAAMLMAGIVNAAGKDGQVKPAIAILATFLTTFVSGAIFMVIKMAMLGVVGELAAAMLPVVAMTAVFNAILVGALYLPIQKALRLN